MEERLGSSAVFDIDSIGLVKLLTRLNQGEDIAGIGPVRLAKRGMARAFQLVNIFPGMSVAQTIAVAVSRK